MCGFAVIGCSKCRKKIVADLSYDMKTCQCGNRIQLRKTRLLAVTETAAEAGDILRALNAKNNTGFTAAQKLNK